MGRATEPDQDPAKLYRRFADIFNETDLVEIASWFVGKDAIMMCDWIKEIIKLVEEAESEKRQVQ